MAHVLGIDLGTTRSVMAVVLGGAVTVLPNAEGYYTTPSVVAFPASGETLVGEPAARQIVINPTNTIRSAKRFIGRRYDDPVVAHEAQYVPYSIVQAPNGDAWIESRGKFYSPTEIAALILRKLKQDAEAFLGELMDQAVITVPAYFTQNQRRATFEAAALAGLKVLRIFNEPTAASLAYGLDRGMDEQILVYDLGGGTFDVTVLELGDGVFEVKSTKGDAHLGGDDFDDRVAEWLALQFQDTYGVDPRGDAQAYQRLREAAEQAKIELSQVSTAGITIPFLWTGDGEPRHLVTQISRGQLEQLTRDLIERTVDCVALAFADVDLYLSQIDHVVLAGGMTRMPAIAQRLEKLFGKPLPRGVNQDEAVARGAAIQAGVLTGDIRNVLLLDATSHALGIETSDNHVLTLIERNVTTPTQHSAFVTTSTDGQTELDLQFLEGDQTIADNNISLGLVTFGGIAPGRRGSTSLEVTLDIDANYALDMSCKDVASGRILRRTLTGVEQRQTRPRPEALPAIVIGSENSEVQHAVGEITVPAEAADAYRKARQLASTLRLLLADGATLALGAGRERRWAKDESQLYWSGVVVAAQERTGSKVDIYVSADSVGILHMALDDVEVPEHGHPRLLVQYCWFVPSATTISRGENYPYLALKAVDLNSGRTWSQKCNLLDIAPLQSTPYLALPVKIEDNLSARPAPPPPVLRMSGARSVLGDDVATASDGSRPEPALRIFVSHTHNDSAFCREFVIGLRESGADVWYDEDNMTEGMLLDIVQQELATRPIFIVMLSPASLNQSRWVKLEVTMAFQKMLTDQRWHLLPVTAARYGQGDLDDRWLALRSLYRIESEDHRPLEPRQAARIALQRLRHPSTSDDG